MSDPLLDRDDVSASYMQARSSVSADDAIARARARVLQGESMTQQSPSSPAAEPRGGGAPAASGDGGAAASSGVKDTVKSVGATVARNVKEIPAQAIGGVSDFVHNAFTGLSHLGDWLNENVADLRVPIPLTGVDPVDQLLANPALAVAGEKGAIADAKTPAGGATREIARFLTGFIPAFRALKGFGPAVGGTVAGAASDAAGRAPAEENLSNLVQSVPALRNPVTEFLASSPEDGEALARFKKGLEGLGFGGLTEGLFRAVAAMRGARGAGVTVDDAAQAMAEQRARYGEIGERDFLILGDPREPMVKTRSAEPEALAARRKVGKLDKADKATDPGVPDDIAAKGLVRAGEAGGKQVYVNFGRIAEPEDVKKVIGQMADAFAGDIDQARRGVQSKAETQKLADELGMSVPDLLQRRKGQPFNAEEAVAARRLWNASAEKLLELAKRASDPTASPVDQFNFRRMMSVHYAIQAEVIGARTETARALQSWSIPVGGGIEKARAVQTMLDQMGGPSFSQAMARRLALLAEQKAAPEAVNGFVRKSWGAATMDVMQEAWINALLSSPKTHIVNMTSNVGVAIQQMLERGVAARLAELGGSGGVAPGEATAMAYGLVTGIRDAFRLSAKALRQSDNAGFGDDALGMLTGSKTETREPSITGDFLRESGHNGIAAGVDLLGHAIRVPTRLLGAEDAFFKSIGYRMELHAQAVRQAHAEGLRGPELGRRMAEIVASPPEHIRLAAADAALYNTFTNATGNVGAAMMSLRNKVPATTFIIPFVRTPVNIARYAFERSPLAPLVGQWRDDLAAGGARAELATARMGLGTAAMLMAADFADLGVISGGGPDDPGERETLMRQGWQPYSVRVGDRWYSYNRADPAGMTLGFAADLAELARRYDIEPEELDEINETVAAGIAAVARTSISKTYLQGLSEFVEMVSDPERYSPDYISGFLASWVPAGVAAVKNLDDPVMREAMNAWDAAQARLPVLSRGLPARRDLWGEVRRPESGFGPAWDALSPVAVRQVKASPIDAEIERLNLDIRRIPRKADWNGVPVNFRDWPGVYERYQALAGHALEHPAWGVGTKELLDAVVSGRHELSEAYAAMSDGEDGGKAMFVKREIAQARQRARAAIEADPEFADFVDHVAGKKQEKIEKQMPAGAVAPVLR